MRSKASFLTYDHGHPDDESDILELNDDISRPRGKGNGKGKKSNTSSVDGVTGKTRMSKEERLRLNEEKKQQKEREKLQKAAQKAEAAEIKKREKEKEKWEKGKFAHKSIVAHIDTKVVELGSIGGHLLSRLAEKGLSFRVSSNPIEKSIVWSISVPEEISKISSEVIKVPYILIICEAEEFCDLVNSESLMSHISRVQRLYPLHTVCYLTNKLMAYINKREQGQYKDPANHIGWKRPPIEEVLSKLTINFVKVHSRHCVDEAELAEHVAGLTYSLASCQFRNKLTRLSVNANGSLIPKSCVDKDMIKKSPWLKALVAIPKVQPRFAIAIWKKYPTMKSLLHVYMDPSKSVHEKEFLLKDLKVENMLGDDRKLGEICSRRVYRILMAQCGSIKTDDIESGADFFSQHSAE
uniref:Crossover junction endonuclease EME1B-like n=1 Tax=Nicotiana sylvestris TaxID=4096 RepID=A0A1U7X3G6_NICSY|nr:PREDICTED: crossover junction endonuclease EME1B-like [Nicotiana sylvestris]